MPIPKVPPPPKTGIPEWDAWAESVYEWMGRATIDGLRKVNGKIVAKTSTVPSAPVIARQVMSIPIGQEFAFNYIDATTEAVDGYWIYKSVTANDVSTASRYKQVGQSNDGGIYTFQDNTGAGVIAFYWVSAFNGKGESAKVSAGASGTSLAGNQTNTVLRPSTSAGRGYNPASAAYDNNLNAAASAVFTVL